MGVFSDDEERDRRGPRDNPRYAGKAIACATCGKHFVPGDMLYVINTKSGQAVVCFYDADDYEAKVLGKPSCLAEWYKQTGSTKQAHPMVFPC